MTMLSNGESSSRTERLLAEIHEEFAGFRLCSKENDPLSKCIDGCLRALTLGQQRDYLSRYVTTLGQRVYVPGDWSARTDEQRYIVLRHERVHLRQFRRYGWLGMITLYAFAGLPLGLAWGRARLEWEAYQETLYAIAEVHGAAALHHVDLQKHILKQFCGPAYGWMWPFPKQVQAWINHTVKQIIGESKRCAVAT